MNPSYIPPSGNYHCNICAQFGANVARYKAVFTFKGGHEWEETFPCAKSCDEFISALAPFLEKYNTFKIEGVA